MASKRPPGTYSPSARTGRRGGWSGSVAGMVRRAGSDALLMSLRSTVPVGSSAASIGAAETAWIGRGRAGLLRRSSAIPATGAGLGSRGGGRRGSPGSAPEASAAKTSTASVVSRCTSSRGDAAGRRAAVAGDARPAGDRGLAGGGPSPRSHPRARSRRRGRALHSRPRPPAAPSPRGRPWTEPGSDNGGGFC